MNDLKKLTQDDISLETEIEVGNVAAISTDEHIYICTCNAIDDILFSYSLNILSSLLVQHLIVESVGSGFACIW